MTSNEDAEIRKKVYKPLKRGSPTPLYYPLARRRPPAGAPAGAGAGGGAPRASRSRAKASLPRARLAVHINMNKNETDHVTEGEAT